MKLVEIDGEMVDIETSEGARKYLESEGVDMKGFAGDAMRILLERKRRFKIPICSYCGKKSECSGQYPEGCFLENERAKITKL